MKLNTITKLMALSAAALITATSAYATNIPITGGDFETPVVGPTENTYGYIPNQSGSNGWTLSGGSADLRVFTAGSSFENGGAPVWDGSQVGDIYVNGHDSLGVDQKLTYTGGGLGTFQADTTYTLTIQAGVSTYSAYSLQSSINLTGDGTKIVGSTPVNIQQALVGGQYVAVWTTFSVTFDTTLDPSHNGQAIGLYVGFNNNGSDYNTNDLALDNATLTSVANVPEPGTFAMLLGGVGMLTMFRRRRA
jgi:hypothetical protein